MSAVKNRIEFYDVLIVMNKVVFIKWLSILKLTVKCK